MRASVKTAVVVATGVLVVIGLYYTRRHSNTIEFPKMSPGTTKKGTLIYFGGRNGSVPGAGKTVPGKDFVPGAGKTVPGKDFVPGAGKTVPGKDFVPGAGKTVPGKDSYTVPRPLPLDSRYPGLKYTKSSIYTEVEARDIFIYSALFTRPRDGSRPIIKLASWEDSKYEPKAILCCYLYEDGTTWSSPTVRKNRLFIKSLLRATQYHCPEPNIEATQFRMSVAPQPAACSDDVKTYVNVEYTIDVNDAPMFVQNNKALATETSPEGAPFSLAVCVKNAYGSLDPEMTIEYIEYYRKMGASLIVLYVSPMRPDTAKVIEYYQRTGFVSVLVNDYPRKGRPERNLGDQKGEAWNDVHVITYDCQVRTINFKYVGLLDMDEFIVPNKENNFKEFLEKLHQVYPNTGAFRFLPTFHVIDWGKSSNSSDLLILQYGARTEPVDMLQKHFYVTEHFVPDTLSGHQLTVKPPYKVSKVADNYGAIAHYRRCHYHWKGSKCFDFRRIADDRVARLVDAAFAQSVHEARAGIEQMTSD